MKADMKTHIKTEKKISIRQILTHLISIVIMGYFTYHIFKGDRGVIAYFRMQQIVADHEKELAEQNQLRKQIEKRVYLLKPDSLDLDLLEERARSVLNYAHPDEIIIHEGSIGSSKSKK